MKHISLTHPFSMQLKFPWLSCLALMLLFAASARAATYIYIGERGLPSMQGWTVDPQGGSQVGSQTIVGDTLVVTDNDAGDRAFNYGTNHAGVTINATNFFQMRSMVRLETNNIVSPAFGTLGVSLYGQALAADDSGRDPGLVLRYEPSGSGSNQFSFASNTTGGFISTPWDSTSFYEVVVTKPASANAFVTMTLQVFGANSSGVTNGTTLGTLTFNYASLNDAGLTSPILMFGNIIGGAPKGTFDLKWATYGIGEAAPELVPEPSTALLGLIGGLIVCRRMRRH